MMPDLDPDIDLSFTRTLAVPRWLVWECWTDPIFSAAIPIAGLESPRFSEKNRELWICFTKLCEKEWDSASM